MDGLHKLKTPGLYASLFFQVTSIYLLFQATNLRSHSFLQEGLPRRVPRDAQAPMEGPIRAQEIQCSEGLAAYQWGAIGSILLSAGCLSPSFLMRRKEESGLYKAEKNVVTTTHEPDPSLASEGAWIKEPTFNAQSSAGRRTETRDNVYRGPRDNIYRGPNTAPGVNSSPYSGESARTKTNAGFGTESRGSAGYGAGYKGTNSAGYGSGTSAGYKSASTAGYGNGTSGTGTNGAGYKGANSPGYGTNSAGYGNVAGYGNSVSGADGRGAFGTDGRGTLGVEARDAFGTDGRGPLGADSRGTLGVDGRGPLGADGRGPLGVDGRGNGVDGRGNGIDGRGNGIDGRGNGIDGRGNGIDGRGNGIDGRGNGIDGRGPLGVDGRGPLGVDGRGPLGVDGRGNGVDGRGNGVDGRGNGVDGRGNGVDGRGGPGADRTNGAGYGNEGAWMKDSRGAAYGNRSETVRGELAYQSEGAWMKDNRNTESAYLSETHRSETYRSDGSHRSETIRSEAAYRTDGQTRSEGAYRTEGWASDTADVGDMSPYKSLKKGLEELELCLKNQSTVVSDGALVRSVGENVRLLESRNRSTYESLIAGHDEIQKATSRLQRLMEQCRDSANYSATNRVDWKKNKLIDILTQMRQNLDMVVDLSKNINSIHASTLRMLGESLHSESILNDKISRAQEQLERIQSNAHSGTKVHDTMISIIGESRDNITGATKFVGSLGQKWDAIVHMTEELDEVADRINQQTLAASLEMVRGTNNSHNVTDLFPLGTELRGLAATFHTYARQVKDAIHDVRDEMGKTTSYLTQAGAKADLAFVSVTQCGEYYRTSVNAVKHSASELVLLQQEVNIHMKKLQDTRSMGQNSAELLGNLDRHLQGHNGFGMKIMDETSQITVHSEKISTLLAKQYHELNHSQKMLASSAPLLTDSIRFTMETTQTISTLAACLNRAQPNEDGSSREMLSRNEEVIVAKIENFKQLIASLKDQPVVSAALDTSAQNSVMKQRALAGQQPRTPATWRVMN